MTRFRLQPRGRSVFTVGAAGGFVAFAVMGLFSSLGAIIVHGRLGIAAPLIAGLVPFAAFAASAVIQFGASRLSLRAQWTVGAVLLPIGLALAALTIFVPSLALFLTAAVVAGAGAGLLFKGGVSRAATAAAPDSRAGVLAWFFVISYLGMGLPSVVFAEVIAVLPLGPTMIGFGALFSVGAVAAVIADSALSDRGGAR